MSLTQSDWPTIEAGPTIEAEPVGIKLEKQDSWEPIQTGVENAWYNPLAPQYYDFFPPTTIYDADIALGQSTLQSLDQELYPKVPKPEVVQSCSPQEISSPIRSDSSTPSSASDTSSTLSSAPTSLHADCFPPPTPFAIDVPLFPEYAILPGEPLPPFREAIKENPEQFVFSLFPAAAQALCRDRLRREVLSARWWLENKPEPSGLLNQFVRRLNSKLFECMICGKKLKRIDRAVDHVRVHLEHRPYRCDGKSGCGDTECEMAFYTRDCLKSHCSKHEKQCQRCGATVEDKNLSRHQLTRKCRSIRRASSGSN